MFLQLGLTLTIIRFGNSIRSPLAPCKKRAIRIAIAPLMIYKLPRSSCIARLQGTAGCPPEVQAPRARMPVASLLYWAPRFEHRQSAIGLPPPWQVLQQFGGWDGVCPNGFGISLDLTSFDHIWPMETETENCTPKTGAAPIIVYRWYSTQTRPIRGRFSAPPGYQLGPWEMNPSLGAREATSQEPIILGGEASPRIFHWSIPAISLGDRRVTKASTRTCKWPQRVPHSEMRPAPSMFSRKNLMGRIKRQWTSERG